jgi:dipeptidyl aminopeptidase/acylaminoacyl peptidase
VQVTRDARNHVLTHTAVWSPDSRWIVYDTRPDAAGEVFQGSTIEQVNVETGEVQVLFRAGDGAHCGVATYDPSGNRVVFILGPTNPTPDWAYGPYHRQGVWVDTAVPGHARNLDARDLTPPFTPGALRGGSHVHVYSADGQRVSFTYEDAVLARFAEPGPSHDMNLRGVGVSAPAGPVRVDRGHPRNHDGEWFSVLVTRTMAEPAAGSDQIKKAFEEGWVGTNGYVRADGSRQLRALAFQGHVIAPDGRTVSEVFLVDLPEDLTAQGEGPLAGTEVRAPQPPAGVEQRRLTRTADRRHPGIQGPRHWLHSSPDGGRIGFLMKDDDGVVQFWTVSPRGGEPVQVTHHPWDVASVFAWSPDGRSVAFVMDHSVWGVEVANGQGRRLTPRTPGVESPRPEACVWSPDGRSIAFVRQVDTGGTKINQVFLARP